MSDINKALFISLGVESFAPGITGGEMRFIEIAKGWANKGMYIHLLGSKGAVSLCERMKLKVIPHVIEDSTSKGRLSFILKAFKALFIPKSLEGFKEGIVYSTNEQLYDVLPGLRLKLENFKRVKWGVVVHWLPPYRFWERKQSTLFNSLLFLISERVSLYLACLFADKLLAVSESTKKQIETDIIAHFFIHKVVAVSCGVPLKDLKQVRTTVSEAKYDAVFMKRLQAVKGIFDVIDIWNLVIKKFPDAKLAIIGSGIDEDAAKKKVKDFGLTQSIDFLGAIFDFKTKFSLVSSAKLFLLPTYEENWAIVVGESLGCGTPVITYHLDELADVWKDSIVYSEVGNIKEFADKTIHLLEDGELRSKLIKAGFSFVSQYDWGLISERELALFSNE